MKELLVSYSIEGEQIGEIEKKEFHETMKNEFLEKGKVSKRHKDVKLLLLTSNGRLILQRRSKWKGDNAGMWDKTIGGHVTKYDSFDLTVLKECAEELGIPATVVAPSDFMHTVSVTNLHVLGVLTKLIYLDNFQSSRKLADGKKWIEPSMSQFYIGYYDGAMKFIDKESCGIQVFSLEEVESEMEEYAELYTDDLTYMINKFKHMIKPVEKFREKVLND